MNMNRRKFLKTAVGAAACVAAPAVVVAAAGPRYNDTVTINQSKPKVVGYSIDFARGSDRTATWWAEQIDEQIYKAMMVESRYL